jgi:hypothetical protein
MKEVKKPRTHSIPHFRQQWSDLATKEYSSK